MNILIDRGRRSDDHLGVRMALFTLGAALALAGMTTGRRLLVWVATVVLLIAFALRFRTSNFDGEDEPEETTGDP